MIEISIVLNIKWRGNNFSAEKLNDTLKDLNVSYEIVLV